MGSEWEKEIKQVENIHSLDIVDWAPHIYQLWVASCHKVADVPLTHPQVLVVQDFLTIFVVKTYV